MPIKRYTMQTIEAAWHIFQKRIIYRALVAGKWQIYETIDEAREANPHKVEVKFARDAMQFPQFLAGLKIESIG